MIAQKLSNNKIAITSGNVGRKDALQTIEDLRVSEFFRLSRAARNWEKSLNDKRDIMFTTYENEHSKVCKEFDSIYQRRQLFIELDSKRILEEEQIKLSNEQEKEPKEEKSQVKATYKSLVIGTSKLIRIPSKQIIKIVRRKGKGDSNNKINCVCINNKVREEFFSDCKKLQHYQYSKVYEIMYEEDSKEIYEKWDSLITQEYEKGLPSSILEEMEE